ncbi:ABC transporter substrate-binding protein [Okibacterium endophyticum]
MSTKAQVSRVPSLSRSVSVIRCVAQLGRPQSVSAIARETGLPKTSVLGICSALADERMLTRGADGSYWLGPRLAEFAASERLHAGRTLRLGLLIPTRDNQYYTAMLSAAEHETHSSGSELHIRDANSDPDEQRRQWNELLSIGVDAILVDAVDSDAFDDLLERSRTQRVPVLAIGSRMNGVNASVTSDNTQAGLLAGHYLAARLQPGAKVAIVDGLHKNANADRVAGFREALRDHPRIEIATHVRGRNDDPASGRTMAERLLRDVPDVSAVFAVCDPVAFGVTEHLTRVGARVTVASVDGRAQAIDQLGRGPIVATAAQDPERIIRSALELATELCNGTQPVQAAVLIPVRLVTAENASGYTPWG